MMSFTDVKPKCKVVVEQNHPRERDFIVQIRVLVGHLAAASFGCVSVKMSAGAEPVARFNWKPGVSLLTTMVVCVVFFAAVLALRLALSFGCVRLISVLASAYDSRIDCLFTFIGPISYCTRSRRHSHSERL